jgi:hypothetical protein
VTFARISVAPASTRLVILSAPFARRTSTEPYTHTRGGLVLVVPGLVLALASYFGGAVAQLGARLDGIEEVVGSNPIGSTI